MTIKEYQDEARKTAPTYKNNTEKLYHAVFGLCSEAGEVAGILQKTYQGHEMFREHMLKELGDCLWMISEACDALTDDMEHVMILNIQKLRARFPEGHFSAERSLHRKEGDI